MVLPNHPSAHEIDAFFANKNLRAQLSLLENYTEKVKKIQNLNLTSEQQREEIASLSNWFGSESTTVKDCLFTEKIHTELRLKVN